MNDILLDSHYNMVFANGDIATGFSDSIHQELLLVSNKGDFKASPTIGVGLAGWLKDNDGEGLLGEIKKEFERDGMTVKKVELLPDYKINIDASY